MYLVLFNSSTTGPVLPQDPGDAHNFGAEPVLGPFDTQAAAYRAIIEDAEECFNNGDGSRYDEPEKYASRAIIVKVVNCVRPIPRVKISWDLDDVEWECDD
jgi:hypothetical protein